MRRLRFIIPKEGIDHFSICPCIRSKPMPRSVAKIGDIFPKPIYPPLPITHELQKKFFFVAATGYMPNISRDVMSICTRHLIFWLNWLNCLFWPQNGRSKTLFQPSLHNKSLEINRLSWSDPTAHPHQSLTPPHIPAKLKTLLDRRFFSTYNFKEIKIWDYHALL